MIALSIVASVLLITSPFLARKDPVGFAVDGFYRQLGFLAWHQNRPSIFKEYVAEAKQDLRKLAMTESEAAANKLTGTSTELGADDDDFVPNSFVSKASTGS